jgi:ubiquinone/menaquinone biosynthesis C-methylase UbiE
MKRRDLFPIITGLASAAALTGATEAQAATRENRFDPYQMPDDMRQRYATRMPTLDLQASEDFYGSFRLAMADQYKTLENDVRDSLAEQGIKPKADCSLQDAWDYCMKDPRFAMQSRTWVSSQQLMWSAIADSFHARQEQVLAELEKTDRMGPGKLELNPDMEIPEYTRYEIHIQPRGYVGDPLAGAISAFGSKHFGRASSHLWNDHQERHLKMAQDMPTPKTGDVRRILDMGTGWGSLAASLKERFPDAEVWGIDVGGPQVRWAHYRAVKLGLDVNYAQRLAEDTKFPNAHFDIVTSYILHHEVTAVATKKIVEEAFRVLRPGGVFKPMDFITTGNPDYKPPQQFTEKALRWRDHRYNNEVWTLQFRDLDLPGLLRSTGFVEVTAGDWPGTPFGTVVARKPA